MHRVQCSIVGCQRPNKAKGLCSTHYQQCKRPKPTDPRYFLGMIGESAVRDILKANGRHVEDQPFREKFDFRVDGYRVEVKTGEPKVAQKHKLAQWKFNIYRNGILDEHTDFYVFRMEGVPNKQPINLLLRAPLGVSVVRVSERSLAKRFSKAVTDFEAFANGEYGRKNAAA